MAKYHDSPITGKMEPCSGNCLYGEENAIHVEANNRNEAESLYVEKKFGNASKFTTTKKTPVTDDKPAEESVIQRLRRAISEGEENDQNMEDLVATRLRINNMYDRLDNISELRSRGLGDKMDSRLDAEEQSVREEMEILEEKQWDLQGRISHYNEKIAAEDRRQNLLKLEDEGYDIHDKMQSIEDSLNRIGPENPEEQKRLNDQWDQMHGELLRNEAAINNLDPDLYKNAQQRLDIYEKNQEAKSFKPKETTAEWRKGIEARQKQAEVSEQEADASVQKALSSDLFTHDKYTRERMTTGDQLVGWTEDGRRVTVNLSLSKSDRPTFTTDHSRVDSMWQVSFQGTSSKNNRTGNAGQISEELKQVTVFPAGVTAADRDAVVQLWENNHLNNLQAGCDHQKPVYEKGHGNIDLDNSPKCPHTGYNYGSAWLGKSLNAKELDAGVEAMKKFAASNGKKPRKKS